jgi:formate/nitrite transporter FocA (FNT family)
MVYTAAAAPLCHTSTHYYLCAKRSVASSANYKLTLQCVLLTICCLTLQVTLGNIIGGAVAVAGMYSLAFGSLGKKTAKPQL